ncbi:MAG: ribonuclease HI family protein [Desulfobacterales bacterium]|nr:ribonuclease HI family protein [Desulfobacterales bacterium]MDZ4341698.1 ribonuclease HI family protein [Candidatus Binatia bacterium]
MITVFFDGACEPVNPGGIAAYGVIIQIDGKEIFRESKIVAEGPMASNNVAEYNGLIAALRYLFKHKYKDEKIQCFGDSKLVIEQMNGNWNINKGLYVEHAYKCRDALKYFPNITLSWVPRLQNIADDVSKDCLRRRGVKFHIQPD